MSEIAANGRRASGGPPLIRLERILKSYQTPAGEFIALRDVDLSIGAGEFVAVVGKSGSGKSTLINMITGIDRPTDGEIYIADTAIHKLAEGPMAEWRGRNIGVIFQFFQLLPMLSCIENVMLPMDFCDMFKPSEREARALDLLHQVDMASEANKLPSEISGGQQQRVAIARAMANDPPLIVADEPTGNLDTRSADSVFKLFEDLVHRAKPSSWSRTTKNWQSAPRDASRWRTAKSWATMPSTRKACPKRLASRPASLRPASPRRKAARRAPLASARTRPSHSSAPKSMTG